MVRVKSSFSCVTLSLLFYFWKYIYSVDLGLKISILIMSLRHLTIIRRKHMKQTANTYVGTTFTIPAGATVVRNGVTFTQQRTRNVTVRGSTLTRKGNTRIIWKSLGYKASALLG
jgi:hypothetical protein